MEKLYLLTGAAGNLGGSVSRLLLARGERVRALVLPGDRTASRLPSAIEQVEGDVLDLPSLERFFAAPNGEQVIVIHMAAIVTTYPGFNQKVYDVNVGGVRNILRMCRGHAVKKLVYVSSSSAIPELPRGQTISEPDHYDADEVSGLYAKTKAEAAQLVLDAAKDGLDASVVFPTAIFGPGDINGGPLTQAIIDCCREKLPAALNGGFDAVDVRDVALGIVLCAEKGRSGEGYLLGNRFLSLKELFSELHRLTGAKEIKTMLPLWLLKAAVPFLELYYRARRRAPVFTAFALYNLTRNNMYSSEKAKTELGYTARPISETLADTVAWLRQEKLISAAPRGKKRRVKRVRAAAS